MPQPSAWQALLRCPRRNLLRPGRPTTGAAIRPSTILTARA